MNNEHLGRGVLPNSINKYIPNPGSDAVSITGLFKRSGKITGYQLSNGSEVDKDEGVQMAKKDMIKGVVIAVNKGTEYLRAMPDGEENNNLSNLPTIKH